MKHISIREFQLHAAVFIEEAPIVLTRYGIPIAILTPTLVMFNKNAERHNEKTPLSSKHAEAVKTPDTKTTSVCE